MDFEPSDKSKAIQSQLERFMDEYIYPNERVYQEQAEASADPHAEPAVMKGIRAKAKEIGLWNLFLPDPEHGPGLSNLDYTPLCEVMGRSPMAARAFNCQAPDTGNAEILAEFGTPEQKKRWLEPLLEGEIRSCFSMTEPETSGADPTGLRTLVRRDGDDYVIDGHKWFTSSADGAAVAVVMAVTDAQAPKHQRASMILVPTSTPGFRLVRNISVMGHAGDDWASHGEVRYEGCRVPRTNLVGREGQGFALAQERLGPGRIHHCMRMIGAAQRALELMIDRANTRIAFGRPLIKQQSVREDIARSACQIEQARLLTLKAAQKMDTVGNKGAQDLIAMIKIVAPNMALEVIDRAMQIHGGVGLSQDTPLAHLWAYARTLRLADGPDQVHMMQLGRNLARRREAGG